MKPRVFRVHIQSLMLEGFSPSERHRIGDGVQSELRRLLMESGLPQTLESSPERPGGSFNVSGSHDLGAQVARAVYGGLSR